MITVEGQGKKNSVWTVWVSPPGLPGVPTSVLGFCPNVQQISPVMPCSMNLPAVGSTQVFISPLNTGYGSSVGKIEVGSLLGYESAIRSPLPCQHSTVNGSLLNLGPEGRSNPLRPRFCFPAGEYSIPLYSVSGTRASFLIGKSAQAGNYKARNEVGELVSIVPTTDNNYLWDNTAAYYAHLLPSGYPSPFSPYLHVPIGSWWSWKQPTWGANLPYRTTKHTWKHVSANVWEESWWQVYHHNASYTPVTPYGPDGRPYVMAQIERRRKFTLTGLQQRSPANFRGLFDVEEELEYVWLKANGASPIRMEGSMKGIYQSIVPLTVFEPGLCIDTLSGDLPAVDAFCTTAEQFAKTLYDEQHMITARSNAVADVSGLESNWIENLSQVKGTLDVVLPLIDGYKAVVNKDLSAARRALASAYLAYKYSVAPTISDVKDLDANAKKTVKAVTKYRFSNERRRGACHKSILIYDNLEASQDYHCTLHLQLKDSAFSSIWNALEKLGLDPSIGNLWDLVPFSFVVDWFAKIGPALERISAYVSNVLVRDLKCRIQSHKVQWPLSPGDLEALGFGAGVTIVTPLEYSWYDRRIDYHLGVFDAFAGQSLDGLSVSQMAQGAALLSNYFR